MLWFKNKKKKRRERALKIVATVVMAPLFSLFLYFIAFAVYTSLSPICTGEDCDISAFNSTAFIIPLITLLLIPLIYKNLKKDNIFTNIIIPTSIFALITYFFIKRALILRILMNKI